MAPEVPFFCPQCPFLPGFRAKFGLPFNKEFCPISLDIYPSEEFKDVFMTQTPIIMCSAVALVFVFTAFMFLLYDRLVSHRCIGLRTIAFSGSIHFSDVLKLFACLRLNADKPWS